jgi:hypothetical protein
LERRRWRSEECVERGADLGLAPLGEHAKLDPRCRCRERFEKRAQRVRTRRAAKYLQIKARGVRIERRTL